jgi:hypothetical protein
MTKLDLEQRIKELEKTLLNLRTELKDREQEIGMLNYKLSIKNNKNSLSTLKIVTFLTALIGNNTILNKTVKIFL